jgi:hypothetical protein
VQCSSAQVAQYTYNALQQLRRAAQRCKSQEAN